MTVTQLQTEYDYLKSLDDTDDGIFEFKENLLESDSKNILEFHLNLLRDREDPYLNRDIFSFFSDRKNKKGVSDFIYNKIQIGINDDELLADLIQILGHLRSKYALEVSKQYINNDNRDLRYRSIIVMGWVGTKQEIPILNEKLRNDEDPEIREFAATAMRQIFFKDNDTKDQILSYLYNAIIRESNKQTLVGIIVTAQDLLKKKLGLKESQYGDVEGDVELAKIKTITALEKYGNN